MQWYERPMRIAALQCNYEDGKNLAVIDRWAGMGFNTEQLFHPMADSYSALFDRERHGDLLARYLAKAHRRGLRIILYLNVHIIGPSGAHRRDEWAQQARDGSWPLFYDTYHPCCITGPWRGHFLGVLDSLADVDVDGVFLDGPAVAAGGCWCRACRAEFGRARGGQMEDADEAARHAFFTGQRTLFLQLAYRRFKAAKPGGIFYINLPVTNPAASYVDLPAELACNDIAGSEGGFLFYGPARKAFLWKPGVRARLLEALAPDRPRVVFMAADHKPWSWYPNTPVETRLCIASSSANGASIWWGLHGSTRLLPTPGARAAGDAIRFLARHEEHYAAARSAARVAVLHSYDTERERGAAVEASDFYGVGTGAAKDAGSFPRSFEGFADALCRWSVPWDVVTDLDLSAERLARYDLLILPTCSCLGDRAVDDIRAFVERGGNLVATFDTSRFDGGGRPRGEPGLADVLGIATRGAIAGYRDFNYFSFIAQRRFPRLARGLGGGLEVPLLPAPAFALEVEPRPGAEVLACFHAPMAGRYVDLTPPASPAIVANRFGRGTAVHLAGTFGEMLADFALPEHRRLARNLVDALSRRDVLLETASGGGDPAAGPINVEMTLRVTEARPDRLVVHLVNHAGVAPRPFEAIKVQEGLRLRLAPRLRVRGASALAAGKRLRPGASGKDTVVALPPLAEYEVIVLETGTSRAEAGRRTGRAARGGARRGGSP